MMTFKAVKSMFFKVIHGILAGLHNVLYSFVLHFFKMLHLNIGSKLTVWYMEQETSEHFHLLIKTFKWIILPASLFYFLTNLYFFGNNTLSSIFLGTLVFFYSQFLPDLPSAYRKKDGEATNLPWYKNYALLLFAPILILLLFSGMHLDWETSETFHDFKSLGIYSVFLFLCSFLVFGNLEISVSDIVRIFSMPLYGFVGYLVHLKVDKVW